MLEGTGPSSGSGLALDPGSDGSVIRGFDIIDFFAGIEIESSGDAVQGNYVGVETDGNTDAPNVTGIFVTDANNTIGGTAVGEGNVISGNRVGVEVAQGHLNVVAGNKIGTNAVGTAAVGNGDAGISIGGGTHGYPTSGGTVIGGSTAGAGNVIAGNGNYGIFISAGAMDLVEGNFIGTDAAGTAALPNGVSGIYTLDGTGNTIGGTTPGDRNVISGNTQFGIGIQGDIEDVVAGNFIGTDVTGTVVRANTSAGVLLLDAALDNTIGGTTAGAGNLISGNTEGIDIQEPNGGEPGATGTLIVGNLIGTDLTGTVALGGATYGVSIDSSGNTVGGAAPGDRNVISGNFIGVSLEDGSDNLVLGNLIGTDITGTVAIGNTNAGVSIDTGASDNTIGGLTTTPGTGPGNIISANAFNGVQIVGAGTSGNVVEGNLIGTDITGTIAFANTYAGVEIGSGATDNVIGGTAVGAGNLISGNEYGDGIEITESGTSNNLVEGDVIGLSSGGTALGNSIGVEVDYGAADNTIGGQTSIPGTGAGNVISGNTTDGVHIRDIGLGTTGNVVAGNLIGTDVTGTIAIANSYGVEIDNAAGNLIGGSVSGDANVVSGNINAGIYLYGAATTGTVIAGNRIGTDITGTLALPNASGVFVVNAPDNTIGGSISGDSNLISGNTKYGVYLSGTGTTGTVIAGNKIGTDVTGTLALTIGDGVTLEAGASDNTIGGAAPARET